MGAPTGPVVSRRTLLAAAALPLAALATSACTSEPEPAPPPDPDDLLREEAAERERELLREYDAVLLVLPSLAARLLPLRAEHAEHLAALTPEQASPSPDPSPEAATVPPAEVPPPTAAAALAGLVEAERAASAAHGSAALAASRELAALLAALSASELTHPLALA